MLFINRAIASLKYHRRNSIVVVSGMVVFMIVALALQMLHQIETSISINFMQNIKMFPQSVQTALKYTIDALQQSHIDMLGLYEHYIQYTYLGFFLFLVVVHLFSLHARQSELKAYTATDKSVSWISLQLFAEYFLLFLLAYVIVFGLGIILTFVGINWLRDLNQQLFAYQFPNILKTVVKTADDNRFISNLFHQQFTYFNWDELLAGNTVYINRISIFTSGIRENFFSFFALVILAIIGSSWVGIHWWRFRLSRKQ
jgi:hypothetical protein